MAPLMYSCGGSRVMGVGLQPHLGLACQTSIAGGLGKASQNQEADRRAARASTFLRCRSRVMLYATRHTIAER